MPYKQQLAYLEATATQWINSGVYAPAGAAIETEFSLTSPGTYGIFGGRNNTTANTCTSFATVRCYFTAINDN